MVNHVNKNVCVLCDEVMQSPICALCQTDKVENWIDKKRVATIKEFRNEIRAFLDTVRRYNKLSCTYCRLESNTSVCQGCYNERVYTWLVSKNKTAGKDFLDAFKYSDKKQLIA